MAFSNTPIGQAAAPKRKLQSVGDGNPVTDFLGNVGTGISRAASHVGYNVNRAINGADKAGPDPTVGTDWAGNPIPGYSYSKKAADDQWAVDHPASNANYSPGGQGTALSGWNVPQGSVLTPPPVYQPLATPAKHAEMQTNYAKRADGGPGVTSPDSVWWNANHKDENGKVVGGWDAVGNDGALLTGNAAPARAHGMFSPDFNYDSPDNTQAGGSTYQALAVNTSPAPLPTIGAGPGATNDPFTPGTDAYKARQDAFQANYQQQAAGARLRLQQTLAQQGLTNSGAGLALGNNLEAGLSADYLQGENEMQSNDPLRSLDFTAKGLGNTQTGQQIGRYGAETPLYLKGMGLANEGKSVSNLIQSKDYDKVSALLPYEISAAQTGDAKAKADLDAFQQQAPYHLQQLKAAGKLSDTQAQAAQDAYENRNWTTFWNIIGKVLGTAGSLGGIMLGNGVGVNALDAATAPNSSFGAG